MPYYFSKIIRKPSVNEAVEHVTGSLKAESFGVLTEIDLRDTLKKKIGVEFRNYRILGACNPEFAYKALQAEGKIGTMLPCNVIVEEISPGEFEVSAIDPEASMMAVDNKNLHEIAAEVRQRLKRVIENL